MALMVELFGPPGSGKTTFAKALASRLRATGLEATLQLSSRPGEADGGSPSAALHRMARPVWELVSTRMTAPSHRAPNSEALLLPFLEPLGRVRRVRMRQYLFRLSAAWAGAEGRPGVVIFDQAYLQFIISLLALRAQASRTEVAEALFAVPQADVAIRLDAAPEVLARRLDDRLRKVGALGRWLEAGAGGSDAYTELSEMLHEAFENAGGTIHATHSSEGRNFVEEIERAAMIIERADGKARAFA